MTLIEGWARQWWRLWSVRLAMVAGIVTGWAAAFPDDFKAAMGLLPAWARPLVGISVFALATWVRLVRQEKPGA